jgi:hypothetical protein
MSGGVIAPTPDATLAGFRAPRLSVFRGVITILRHDERFISGLISWNQVRK